MGVKEKLANAESTSSLFSLLTENMTEEEIQEIVTEAKEKARKRIAIYDALDSLRGFDEYSPYQKDLSIVIDYIEELEKENEDLKEAKAIYVERPKTMQEKQAESEKYEKAYDDGYKDGYVQARFDYGQQPCEDAVSRAEILKKQYPKASSLKYLKPTYVVDVDYIKSLPSVQPQPKTGEWIKTFEPYGAEPFTLWECNRCHMIVRGSMKSDYCPFCGARMNGGDKE